MDHRVKPGDDMLVGLLILPDGQISDGACFCLVQPRSKKYFCFSELESVV
jgi:hypothetical protein